MVTIEDGLRDGGVGLGHRRLAPRPRAARRPAVRVLGVPSAYLPHGKADALLAKLGLDADGVVSEVNCLAALTRLRSERAGPRRGSEEGVLAGVVIGGVDDLGHLGDQLEDLLLDALGQGLAAHRAALAAAAHRDVGDRFVLHPDQGGESAVGRE